jgi:hypothetical protein
MVAGAATGGSAGGTAAPGAADCPRSTVVALGDGGKDGDGPHRVGAAAVGTGGWRLGLAHGSQFFKGRAAVRADVFIDRHMSRTSPSKLLDFGRAYCTPLSQIGQEDRISVLGLVRMQSACLTGQQRR